MEINCVHTNIVKYFHLQVPLFSLLWIVHIDSNACFTLYKIYWISRSYNALQLFLENSSVQWTELHALLIKLFINQAFQNVQCYLSFKPSGIFELFLFLEYIMWSPVSVGRIVDSTWSSLVQSTHLRDYILIGRLVVSFRLVGKQAYM